VVIFLVAFSLQYHPALHGAVGHDKPFPSQYIPAVHGLHAAFERCPKILKMKGLYQNQASTVSEYGCSFPSFY
jgi:hypothetical protein